MLLNITFKENVKKINSITFGENEKKIELDFGEGYGGATNKYDGEYDVTPKVVAQTLPTARKLMQKDLVICIKHRTKRRMCYYGNHST